MTGLNDSEIAMVTKPHEATYSAKTASHCPEKQSQPGPRNITFTRHALSYRPSPQRRYQNNLLFAVGLLELTNSLDWPANVFNSIPVPTFAAALMGVGGSVCLLWSGFAFYDLHLSLQNVKLLREERKFLQNLRKEHSKDAKYIQLIDAWLDLNWRELGWELVDRVVLDACLGVSGILVGAGTLMAIGGANPKVYHASNLLSGYIGNSINAAYGVLNACWGIFTLQRFHRHRVSVRQVVSDQQVLRVVKKHSKTHELYSVVNGLLGLVGAAGSLISATMWFGYVMLIPCVISSVCCNLLWRHKIGYTREVLQNLVQKPDIDVLKELQEVLLIQQNLGSHSTKRREKDENEKIPASSVEMLLRDDLYEDFCLHLLRKHKVVAERLFGPCGKSIVIDHNRLLLDTEEPVQDLAASFMLEHGRASLRHRERVLTELLGCLCRMQVSAG